MTDSDKFYRLSPEEIEALREEMKQASAWARQELARRRHEKSEKKE